MAGNYLAQVKEFHEKFQLPKFTRYNSEIHEQRIDHMSEELGEYIVATYHKNDEATLDALADLMYVLVGTIIMHGFEHIFDEAFKRVHAANMAKSRHIPGKGGDTSKQGIYKPEGWKAPELGDLIDAVKDHNSALT